MQQVAQKYYVSHIMVTKKIEERPPIFVFIPIVRKNTLVIWVLTIFLTYTFQIFLVCVHSIGQRSSSPDDTPHNKIALPDKLHVHAIYRVMQSYCVGCRSTRMDLRKLVLWNERKQQIFE